MDLLGGPASRGRFCYLEDQSKARPQSTAHSTPVWKL